MLLSQELTDRLVVATEEQDVLYVLHWMDEMKVQKCLEEAINEKHSWKGYSAIGSIILSPFTRLRKIILEILLLEGMGNESDNVLELFKVYDNSEVMEFLLNWESGGREQAYDAVRLLILPLERAADWIKSNLPRPPNYESLTTNGPLPAPPSVPSTPPPEQTPISSPQHTVDTSSQQDDSAATLNILDLEQNETDHEEGEIVSSTEQLQNIEYPVSPEHEISHPPISVSVSNPSLTESFPPATTTASNSRSSTAQASVKFGPSILSDTFPLPLKTETLPHLQNFSSFPRPLPVPPNSGPSPRPHSIDGSHTLLLVNLPLYGTSESLAFLTNFPFFVETFPIPDRNQTVGFVQIDSAAEASTLKKDWNGYTVNSAKVKVVHGQTGLKGKEAVDYYFQNEDEIARAFTRDTGKRRRYAQ
ncbi:hypothetical protein JCM5353_007353 [Sporobolomyces roseus]